MSATKILQDYGIMPNQKKKDESVVDFLESTTWFHAMTKAVQKHSEFMQPWKDGYDDMEYRYPDLPGPPTAPPTKGPDIDPITPVKGVCLISCYSPSTCEKNVECHANLSQCPSGLSPFECVNNQQWSAFLLTQFGSLPGEQLEINMDPTRVFPVEIKPNGGAWATEPDDRIIVYMTDAAGNKCQTILEVTCRPVECCTAPGYIAMTFDDASTPDTVAKNNSISVFVQDGCGPYTWSLLGASTGFSLGSASTSGVSNTLSLANTNCGGVGGHVAYATIQVVDDCGTTVSFRINAADGTWETIAGFGRTAVCDSVVCCGFSGHSCGVHGVWAVVYHSNTGLGGAYQAKWDVHRILNCSPPPGNDCRNAGTGNHTDGTGSTCGADTVLGSEYGCNDAQCCDCTGYLYYWTCGTDCF